MDSARPGLGIVAGAVRGSAVAAKAILPEYRLRLFGRGEATGLDEDGSPLRRGFQAEEVNAVLAAKGRLAHWQLLRCRVRYFADGLALGTKSSPRGANISDRNAPAERAPCAEWKPMASVRCAICACAPWASSVAPASFPAANREGWRVDAAETDSRSAPLLRGWARCL